MSATSVKATVKIAPNNPVFDLPVIVGIEEGLFAKAGLDVSFSATYAARRTTRRPPSWRA
jgi:ABC-type nitrate/sulfonate/bicarbonate transport system substrate-binding protein